MASRRPSPVRRLAAIILIGGGLGGGLGGIANPAAADWTGGIEGGTVVREGGNATRLRLRLSNGGRPLAHAFYAEWLRYADDDGYRAGYVPRFWVDERLYLFGELEARIEPPLRIERELLAVGGVGYRLVDMATRGLGVEVGAGVRSTRVEADPNPAAGGAAGGAAGDEEREGLAVVRAAAFQEIADRLRLELDADALQGARLGELRAEAALAYRVAGGAVRLGYRVRRLSFADGPTLDDDDVSLTFTYGF